MSFLFGAPVSSALQPSEPHKLVNTKALSASLVILLALASPAAAQPVGAPAAPAIAQGEHDHGGFQMHGGGHGRGGNSAYAKAKVEERDRLLSKLKSICKGC
jgi:hypothetical protein